MRIEALAIPDVKLVSLDAFTDDRGVFTETYDRVKYAGLGIDDVFVQDSCSRSTLVGTVRGIHFQRPPRSQAKLVRVTRGKAFDVVIDLRRWSPTYGTHVSVILEEGDWRVVYVPVGFGHGFCTLAPDTEVVYKMSDHHSPEHYGGLRWDDPDLGIDWPVDPGAPIVSDSDRAHPHLRELGTLWVVPPSDGEGAT